MAAAAGREADHLEPSEKEKKRKEKKRGRCLCQPAFML